MGIDWCRTGSVGNGNSSDDNVLVFKEDEDMAHGKFEIFMDTAGEYRFHLRASNGEIILASQGYNQKSGCLNGIESVRENAPDAELVDLTKED